MKSPLLFLILLFCEMAGMTQDAQNVALLGQVNRGDVRYSGSWSYIAEDGSEYALLGAKTGTAIYAIDEPDSIVEICLIEGPETNWREITTLGDYAYVVTDVQGNGHSMQVLDLSGLPLSVELVNEYSDTFDKAHIIQRDLYSDAPYLYVMGNAATQGVHIMDVSDPQEVYEIGFYEPGYYIHDCFVKGNLLFAAAFYEGTIDIVDVSNKANPVLLTRIQDPGGNTHSAFLTEDNRHLVVCSELDGLPARIFNVEDLDNVFEVATYTANRESLVHNPYIKGDFVFFSHNTEGLRVVDIADPTVPVEIGFYDTYAGESGGFRGLWSACPFFDSDRVIGGNREDGLYLWEVNRITAGRFYGQVRDSITNFPIFNASIVVLESADTLFSDFSGNFKSGGLPGFYTLLVSAAGYKSKILEIALSEGDSLDVEIVLSPIITTAVTNLEQDVPVLRNYPNPFRQSTVIDLADFPTANSIRIFNAQGQFITHHLINQSQYQLSRAGWPAGAYWYLVLDEQQTPLAKGELLIH